jgi:hypothetical protein
VSKATPGTSTQSIASAAISAQCDCGRYAAMANAGHRVTARSGRQSSSVRAVALTRGNTTVLPRSSAASNSAIESHSLPNGSVSSTVDAAAKSSRAASAVLIAMLAATRNSGDRESRAASTRSRSERLASRSASEVGGE